ncbi:MAG: ferredoxin [Candidatus Peregrinibacteria bacterium]|nr:ferredoxin [Candidatus Peregrinibacteria bacterium]
MSPLKIIHDRQRCIGCNSCVLLAPETWMMDEEEGKSRLVCAKQKRNLYIGEIFECDLEANKKAAEACPVNIIQIWE